MDRRAFAVLLGASLATPRALLAQPAARVYRIATLDDAVESVRAQSWQTIRKQLEEFGFVEGKNVVYEARFARGDAKRLPALAAELVALKPDIIVTASTPGSIAAMRATSSIPIVFYALGDPLGSGLVTSLARPGGNVTGTSIMSVEIGAKWLELLRDLSPGANRIAYLADASNKASVATFREMEKRARSMNATVQMLDGRQRADLERSFEIIKRDRIQALVVAVTAVLTEHRDPIVQFAAREKLPIVYGQRAYVDAGGLLSYTADSRFAIMRSADYVQRILRGAKPAELPVERATNFRMVLNLKTASTLGLKVPDSVRLRADEVIE